MQVWKVVLNAEAERELKLHMKMGEFSIDDIRILKAWTAFVEYHGPEALVADYKWDDHPLWGQWEGCRSSCISNSGRIIYKVDINDIVDLVLRVTASHNYR